LNSLFKKNDQPVVIHIGEGTDDFSAREIDRLIKWNFCKRKLVGVHGVAMNPQQAKAFEAVIWCPASNFFLLRATASVNELKIQTKILFGTDSTLSATWNLWEQLRQARGTQLLTDAELFDSLTTTAAAVWNLDGKGKLAGGKDADIVVARRKGENDWSSFYQIDPADILLVISKGTIVLFDETLDASFRGVMKDYTAVRINNAGKFIRGDVVELVNKIKKYAPDIKLPIEM
jgi:cytosine/adenosine deaminase-related metal-dependent hydrolase